MKLFQSIILFSFANSLLVATPQNKQEQELQEINKIGKESSELLLKTLGTNLQKNMKAGGVMKALSFCSNEAYSLTEDVNKELPKGVSVKRISTNYRSPVNKPSGDEEAVLQSLKELQKNNVALPKQIVKKIDDESYKYYKPLLINKEVCLKCHGTLTNSDLKHAITQRYPLDKAINYKMNDLRGAVVVTIKRK